MASSKSKKKGRVIKSSRLKKNISTKKETTKKMRGFVILTGRSRRVTIKGKVIPITKTKIGSKIWKTRELANASIKRFKKQATAFRFATLKPRVDTILVRDPFKISQLKKAKEFIVR